MYQKDGEDVTWCLELAVSSLPLPYLQLRNSSLAYTKLKFKFQTRVLKHVLTPVRSAVWAGRMDAVRRCSDFLFIISI